MEPNSDECQVLHLDLTMYKKRGMTGKWQTTTIVVVPIARHICYKRKLFLNVYSIRGGTVSSSNKLQFPS